MSYDYFTTTIEAADLPDLDHLTTLHYPVEVREKLIGKTGGFVSKWNGHRQLVICLPTAEEQMEYLRTGWINAEVPSDGGRDEQGQQPGVSGYEYERIHALIAKRDGAAGHAGDTSELWGDLNMSRVVKVPDVMSDGPGFFGDLFLIVWPDTSTLLIRHFTGTVSAENKRDEWRMLDACGDSYTIADTEEGQT